MKATNCSQVKVKDRDTDTLVAVVGLLYDVCVMRVTLFVCYVLLFLVLSFSPAI